ncbi:MAG: ResA-like WAxxUGC motif-containing protein, partial [Actinomycetota bacterium]
MILESLDVDVAELERRTGWALKPQGACKAELCVPMPPHEGGTIGANILSERLGMALVEDAEHGLWALGPDTVAGRA